MKRIEFIQPVESMRGSFGSKQDLRYGESDAKAYNTESGATSYARNYQPTFIGAKVARTGLKYFAVKVKSATTNSAAWRLVAALMGAVSAIYGWVLKQMNIYAQLQQQFLLVVEAGYVGTFHKWVCAGIRASLAAKAAAITVVGPTATITLGNNPFSTAAEAIAISQALLVKFWKMLTPNAVVFTVEGRQGIYVAEAEFADIIAKSRLNVLGLELFNVDSTNYVTLGDRFLLDSEGEYVHEGSEPTDNEAYTTTDVAPNA